MAILIVLLIVFSLVLVVQSIRRHVVNVRVAGSIAIAAMFFFTGVSHFTLADSMVLMLPEWFPLRYFIVYVTGVIELMFGIGFLWTSTRRLTGILACLFLLCVFPANIYAALNSIAFSGNIHGPRYLFFRIPLQIFLLVWIWFMTVRKERSTLRLK